MMWCAQNKLLFFTSNIKWYTASYKNFEWFFFMIWTDAQQKGKSFYSHILLFWFFLGCSSGEILYTLNYLSNEMYN